LLFGQLIESGERSQVMLSFLIGAAVMAVAGAVELWLGIAAEQRPLEELALPLTVADAERDEESE
ncbi:MAG: MFS transporter, partial [Mycobacterium sp.]